MAVVTATASNATSVTSVIMPTVSARYGADNELTGRSCDLNRG
jgi:hypothetical protein